MHILTVTAHFDDLLYGVSGTLMAHDDCRRTVVVVAPIQQAAAGEAAASMGVELIELDGAYQRIDSDVHRLREQLSAVFAEGLPDYVFAPVEHGDWSPDHTSAGAIARWAYLDSGLMGQRNSRLLRYPIPATTTSFQANTYIELPEDVFVRKRELALLMVRGAEDIWPAEVVDWEIASQTRFAHEAGWPYQYVEGFDALYPLTRTRLPERDTRTEHLDASHTVKRGQLRAGVDLSSPEIAQEVEQ